jgi:hypothetical protein
MIGHGTAAKTRPTPQPGLTRLSDMRLALSAHG